MSVKNGLLNNDQKKALEKIIISKIGEVRSAITTKNELVASEVDEIVTKRLGLDVLRGAIKAKKDELQVMETKMNEFEGHYGGGIKQKMKQKLLESFDLDGREANKVSWDLQSKLWLAETIEEAKKIVEEPDQLLEKHQKRLDDIKPKILQAARDQNIESIESGSTE